MWAILHGETSNSRSGRLFPSSPTLFVPGAKRSGHLCFIHGPFVHNLTSHKCNMSFNLLSNPLNLSSMKKLHGTNWPPSLQDEADIYCAGPGIVIAGILTVKFVFLVQLCHVFSSPMSTFPSIEYNLLLHKLEP